MTQHTTPSSATSDEERIEERTDHDADRPPTKDEAEAAKRGAAETASDAAKVAEHFKEMNERGAHVKGEGQID